MIEELEDMGKSNLHEVESRLLVLIAHVLKWQIQLPMMKTPMIYQDYDGRSCRTTIIEQRSRIAYSLENMPSLKSKMSEAVTKIYPKAVAFAVDETGLSESAFPTECPYTVEQLLDKKFYPESQ